MRDDDRFERLDAVADRVFPPGVAALSFGEILLRLRELDALEGRSEDRRARAGRRIGAEVVDQWLRRPGGPRRVGGGRWVDDTALRVGVTVSHRLTDRELARGEVRADPDLDLVTGAGGRERRLPLIGGEELVLRMGDDTGWDQHRRPVDEDGEATWGIGPDGWLDGRASGDLLSVTRREPHLELDADVPRADEAQVEAAVAALGRAHARQRGFYGNHVEVMTLLLEVLLDEPGTFSVVQPPVVELLASAGLRYRAGVVLASDQDPPDAAPSLRAELRQLGYDRDLAHEAARLTASLQSAVATSPAAGEVNLREQLRTAALPAVLAVPAAVEVAAGEVLASDGAAAIEPLRILADVIQGALVRGEPPLTGRQEAGRLAARVHYLRGVIAEWTPDPRRQEKELCLALDAAAVPAVARDLAWLAMVRSEPARALGYLRTAGAATRPGLAQVLVAWAKPGPATGGRNDPCPCGSGRTHEVCCGPTNGWPIRARLPWITTKLSEFLSRPRQFPRLRDAAEWRVPPGRSTGRGRRRALEDPVLLTAVAFDGRTVRDLVAAYAPLLPDDELAVLRDLDGTRPAAYRVEAVDPGEGVTLADLVTGARLPLHEPRVSWAVRPGMTVLAVVGRVAVRPDPPGREPALFGVVRPVHPHERASLVDLLGDTWEPADLYTWLAEADVARTRRARRSGGRPAGG